MNVLVVYDSIYGNTRAVALAMGQAIPGGASVRHVSEVTPGDLEDADLLFVGSPTHGALPTEAVQALVEKLGAPTHSGSRAAAFDTRLTWPFLERWGGFAADKLAGKLTEKGWALAGAPAGFFVKGLRKGPLKPGEADRAAAWARRLVES